MMTKTLLRLFSAGILTVAACSLVQAQDTLFTEKFETAGSSFTLNTADASSTTSGYNQWVVNNEYAGGAGSVTCLGFPFTFTVPATPSQPSGIFNFPSSTYLHIRSNEAFNSGVNNCCFQTADGICFAVENYFAAMNTDINTSAYDSVTINFWWLCSGSNNNYGEIYYSTDGGINWIQASVPLAKFYNQSSWTNVSVSIPAFAHKQTLRFGFRFANKVSSNATDPAFGIDDIQITGTTLTGLLNPIASANQLIIYPNASADQISVCNAGNNARVIDMNGKTVMKFTSPNKCRQLDISHLSQGVYAVSTAEGNIKRFLKK